LAQEGPIHFAQSINEAKKLVEDLIEKPGRKIGMERFLAPPIPYV
jgi:hypothetical protein